MNLEEFKTELEKCVIKATWQKNRDLQKQEELNSKKEKADSENGSSEASEYSSNSINFTKLKATDLKNNKRIIIPNLDDDDEEVIRRNNVKKELEHMYTNFMKENCDKFGNMLENNLSEKQVKSIKSLKSKMKDEDIVCFETDKTGELA